MPVALRLLKLYGMDSMKRYLDLLISGGLGLVLAALIVVGYVAHESTSQLIESNQQLTNTRGYTRTADGAVTVELPFPFAYPGLELRNQIPL